MPIRDRTGFGRTTPRPNRGKSELFLALAIPSLLCVGCTRGPASPAGLSEVDETDIRAVERAYTEGWEANDADAVMATLVSDAVIVPDGMDPIRGDSAIRAFWWPHDGSETRVTSYRTTVEEIGGSGTIAYVRGRGDLAFDWRPSAGDEWRSFSSRSVWMAVLRNQADGTWRMTHRMWHQLDEP